MERMNPSVPRKDTPCVVCGSEHGRNERVRCKDGRVRPFCSSCLFEYEQATMEDRPDLRAMVRHDVPRESRMRLVPSGKPAHFSTLPVHGGRGR